MWKYGKKFSIYSKVNKYGLIYSYDDLIREYGLWDEIPGIFRSLIF